MSVVYDIQGITKTYPDQPQPANKNITLQIRESEIFGLLGDNGAGKSTLVKQMANLLASESGFITLLGQVVDADPLFVPLHVGYMPQSGAALNSLTVGEALYFTAHLRGLSRSDARTERERLMSLWELEEIRDRTPDKLSGGQKRLLQLINLIIIQLSNWRWSWRGIVTTGIAAPLLFVVTLGFFARDSGPEALSYVLIGNVVLALMFTLMNRVTSNFAFMRANGSLDYFASLPIHKHNLILATIIAFFLLSLPAVLITIFVGAWILGVSLAVNPLFLPILPLTAIPLAAVGAYIGIRTRTLEDATCIATLLTLVMLGLGPVLIPPDRLPDILITLGYLSPATYAASALRQTLLGPITARLILDIVVLLVLSLVLLWAVSRRLQWRER